MESIRSVRPAENWFVVSINYDENRVFIERVVLWAQVEIEGEIDQVRAIGSTGTTVSHDSQNESWDDYFVFAKDKSPTGQTWEDVYERITPHRTCREIEGDLAQKFFH